MNIYILCYLIFCGVMAIQPVFGTEQQGKTQMARLILDEQFTGTTRSYYEGRGWYDGTGAITTDANRDGYKFEQDSTLGRNVMYVHYASLSSAGGDPKEPASGWRLPLNSNDTQGGATAYILFKFHNIMGSPDGAHWNRFGRGFGQYTPGNSNGQMDMDVAGQGQGNWNHDPSTGQVVDPVYRTFFYYGGGSISYAKAGANDILLDDVWYEIAYYLTPGDQGVMQVVWRRYGDTDWNEHMVGSGIRTASGSGNITQFLIGPYGTRWTNDMRHYYGSIQIFSGNAIADGNLPGGSNGGGTDPLTISNHKVKPSATSATLTWTTNKPSNSVVDIGATEERGTIVRGNDNTTDHVVEIDGLLPNTVYYYRFSSRTSDGETAMDQNNSTFSTKTGGLTGSPNKPEPEPTEISLNDVVDVEVPNAKKGDALVFDGTNWVNVDLDALIEFRVVEILDKTKLVVS